MTSLRLQIIVLKRSVCCRKEKANVSLCCCGLKVNDANVVSHDHPATQPAAVSGATTKPGGAALSHPQLLLAPFLPIWASQGKIPRKAIVWNWIVQALVASALWGNGVVIVLLDLFVSMQSVLSGVAMVEMLRHTATETPHVLQQVQRHPCRTRTTLLPHQAMATSTLAHPTQKCSLSLQVNPQLPQSSLSWGTQLCTRKWSTEQRLESLNPCRHKLR